MSDALHLLLCRGKELDWQHLLERTGNDWRLLLAQIHLFDFTYPGRRDYVPREVRMHLNDLARAAIGEAGDPNVCNGTLVSRFSYTIDVNEWGFRDPRKELVLAARCMPVVQEIVSSDVWEHHPTQGQPAHE